jgi:hypothetical protein
MEGWFEDSLIENFSELRKEQQGATLWTLLKDGVLLCKLMLSLKVKSIPRVHSGADLALGFRRRENIGFFLEACIEHGFPHNKLFSVDDLDRELNILRVLECLEELARKADKEWGFFFKLKSEEEIMKKESEKPFTEEDKKRAHAILERAQQHHNSNPLSGSSQTVRTRTEASKRPVSQAQGETASVEKSVVKLQALVRGWLVRRAYIKRVRNTAYRENVAREIYQTEKDYINNIGLLVELFLDPIKACMEDTTWRVARGQKSGEVTFKDFKSIYSDIQVIRNYNMKLLRDLEPRIDNWTPNQQLGDIFLQIALFLKVYTQYVKDYDQARQELATARKKSPEFRQWITNIEETNKERLSNKDLPAYLIMPVQRIPRYQLLLRDLTKHTEPDHVDYGTLRKALEQISSVADYIEKKAEESEDFHKVSMVQARFANKPESNLVIAGRKFVREGNLDVWTLKHKKRRPRFVFLFNDLVVTAKALKNTKGFLTNKKKNLTLGKDILYESSFHLKRYVPHSDPDDAKNKYGISLLDTEFGEVVVRFYAESELMKTEWFNDLNAVRDKMEKDRVAREDFMKQQQGSFIIPPSSAAVKPDANLLKRAVSTQFMKSNEKVELPQRPRGATQANLQIPIPESQPEQTEERGVDAVVSPRAKVSKRKNADKLSMNDRTVSLKNLPNRSASEETLSTAKPSSPLASSCSAAPSSSLSSGGLKPPIVKQKKLRSATLDANNLAKRILQAKQDAERERRKAIYLTKESEESNKSSEPQEDSSNEE